jgi:hypothetical protein
VLASLREVLLLFILRCGVGQADCGRMIAILWRTQHVSKPVLMMAMEYAVQSPTGRSEDQIFNMESILMHLFRLLSDQLRSDPNLQDGDWDWVQKFAVHHAWTPLVLDVFVLFSRRWTHQHVHSVSALLKSSVPPVATPRWMKACCAAMKLYEEPSFDGYVSELLEHGPVLSHGQIATLVLLTGRKNAMTNFCKVTDDIMRACRNRACRLQPIEFSMLLAQCLESLDPSSLLKDAAESAFCALSAMLEHLENLGQTDFDAKRVDACIKKLLDYTHWLSDERIVAIKETSCRLTQISPTHRTYGVRVLFGMLSKNQHKAPAVAYLGSVITPLITLLGNHFGLLLQNQDQFFAQNLSSALNSLVAAVAPLSGLRCNVSLTCMNSLAELSLSPQCPSPCRTRILKALNVALVGSDYQQLVCEMYQAAIASNIGNLEPVHVAYLLQIFSSSGLDCGELVARSLQIMEKAGFGLECKKLARSTSAAIAITSMSPAVMKAILSKLLGIMKASPGSYFCTQPVLETVCELIDSSPAYQDVVFTHIRELLANLVNIILSLKAPVSNLKALPVFLRLTARVIATIPASSDADLLPHLAHLIESVCKDEFDRGEATSYLDEISTSLQNPQFLKKSTLIEKALSVGLVGPEYLGVRS